MIISKKSNYYLCEVNNNNDFSDLITFLKSLEGDLSVIINLLGFDYNSLDVYKSLLPFHFIWQKTNKSFILVSNMIEKDSQELIFIKTLEEAIDYFYMEELTRNI
ncbi:MAG: hypothetical protein CBD51_006385 [Flavobacteriales bacterium TMED191]|nr:MAG: hypothetical protein CBD51_006385 [Flavobacteriales bacterium TMED191]